ncbi:SRPBCC family protein [Flaviaesturariibacter aridisoli]|uniref:SRPBCC domain-containing protein n=1 Tax=Flaviaesturariibacter aridisoli TaxID=2545761 RepID=A0A4R4DZQ6_9BACT|nr:SRPBCC domain-containing protein [Flaviaesturariibacter aridisoli]TCZ72171.1 SRPBCC domain-containing protein [Flaviaesturariibacter aridisoli]
MQTEITQDGDRRLHITRRFAAAPEAVWKAWTESELLEQWWAPRPWKAVTVAMDFRPGGAWRYYMESPEGARHYCRVDYETIVAGESFSARDAFTDEHGHAAEAFPNMHWQNRFSADGDGTLVTIDIDFATPESLQRIVEMGFKGGFTMAHGNLDELLAKQAVAGS